jgi:hypothetical protein
MEDRYSGNYEPKNALSFKTVADCLNEGPKTWLIENVIALGEDSSWFGPPGSLKSALLTEIALHVASERDWRGYRFNASDDGSGNEIGGVVYFALERGALTRRRVAAYVKRDNLPGDLPLFIVDRIINVVDPSCVDIIFDTIYQAECAMNCSVRLVIFDTTSKAIAAGNGDEDKALYHNIMAANLKKVRDLHAGNFHIAMIGHTGKNEKAGERGSNAKEGHVDLAVQLSGNQVRTATVVKANDQPKGPLASFETEEVTVTRPPCTVMTDTGPEIITPDPYTVTILAPYDPAMQAREVRTDVSKLTPKQVQALDLLRRAIAAHGQDGAVHVDFWKEALSKAGILNLKSKNPRSAFKKLRDGLSQHIIEAGGLVRIKNEIPPLPCPVYPSLVPMSPP